MSHIQARVWLRHRQLGVTVGTGTGRWTLKDTPGSWFADRVHGKSERGIRGRNPTADRTVPMKMAGCRDADAATWGFDSWYIRWSVVSFKQVRHLKHGTNATDAQRIDLSYIEIDVSDIKTHDYIGIYEEKKRRITQATLHRWHIWRDLGVPP